MQRRNPLRGFIPPMRNFRRPIESRSRGTIVPIFVLLRKDQIAKNVTITIDSIVNSAFVTQEKDKTVALPEFELQIGVEFDYALTLTGVYTNHSLSHGRPCTHVAIHRGKITFHHGKKYVVADNNDFSTPTSFDAWIEERDL